MKFTLKDYQHDAVGDVLERLDNARTNFHMFSEATSFSLCATTGAGKTVMAAAVIESLFYGNADFDFDADPGAVVLWFSDDPNLNDQTRFRLMEASEKLVSADLIKIQPPFSQRQFAPSKVYFLNTGKLTKNSLLTRGHDQADDEQAFDTMTAAASPDMQGWTIWQTIANTIEDPDLTVYMILDEAHRGFRARTSSDKSTIVQRLVNGHAGIPRIPIVWGISATIERFREAMKEAHADKSRTALKDISVDPTRVSESGLVKDTIVLDIPDEAGNFDSNLVTRAARKLRESTERWNDYAKSQGLNERVHPLLVLQSPNTPDPDTLGIALGKILDEYRDLGSSHIAHVLGEHKTLTFGTFEVPYIEPQRVEDATDIRVLIAKDGISTGWDCPRAEVLVSFRPAKDHTHITQLLGRMVRSPLARRVPGNERLNAVDCILPFFDKTTAGNVVKFLTGKIEDMPAATRKVILDGRELLPNPNIGEDVWKCWDSLPTMTMPTRGARPVKRLVALAAALSSDKIREKALDEAHRVMHAELKANAIRFEEELDKSEFEVNTVRGLSIKGTKGVKKLSYEKFEEQADERAIRTAFEDAKKAFGPDIAQSFVNHIAGDDKDDDGLRSAYVRISALSYVREVRLKVDLAANDLSDRWFGAHGLAINELNDERQQEYDEIRAMAVVPVRGTLKRPRSRLDDYAVVGPDNQIAAAKVVGLHLMSDEDGNFPIGSLNPWEQKVLRLEMDRPSFRGWYRNPPRASSDSLAISYQDAITANWRSMHPDFVFFHEVDGVIRASIVDPHGHHLPDADGKLRALAWFASKYGDEFHRIEAVSEVGHVMKTVDLKLPQVRDSVLHGNQTAAEIYRSSIAFEHEYLPEGSK